MGNKNRRIKREPRRKAAELVREHIIQRDKSILQHLVGEVVPVNQVKCPFAEEWRNQEGWLDFNGKLVCLDWDDYCTLCRADEDEDYEFAVTP